MLQIMKEIHKNLNQLLFQQQPIPTVVTSSWLNSQGVSYRLQSHYQKKGILTSIGKGAYSIHNENPNVLDGVLALNKQLGFKIHIGGYSVLTLYGQAHFISSALVRPNIFTFENVYLPKWLLNLGEYNLYKTNFINNDLGIDNDHVKPLMSLPERAILEMLYLCPTKESIKHTYLILDMLVNLKPELLQQLLESCTSIKVKRLFLYMTEKIGHSWFHFLDLSKIDLGSGKRVITKGGKFDKKYNIVIENLDNI